MSEEPLAELPFLVLAVALARDVELTEAEIAAAQNALNALDFPELMSAVAESGFSHTEQFEMAWLCEDPSAAVRERSRLLVQRFGQVRAAELRQSLLELARSVAEASDRPLRGMKSKEDRKAVVRVVAEALGA